MPFPPSISFASFTWGVRHVSHQGFSKCFRGAIAALALFAVLTATGGAARAAEPKTVHVALFSWPGYAFWFLAKEKNFVPEINLDVQIIEDPYQSFGLMSAGKLDVASSTAEYAPIAASEKNGIRFVAYTNPSHGTDQIIVRPEIKSAKDLKGKSVAVLEGGLTQIYMGIWLQQNGVSFKDVKFTNLVMDVAGGEFWEPYARNVKENLEGAKVMATSATPFWSKNGLLADAMYMRKGFIDEDNGKWAALAMKAYYEAVKYWREHPKEANAIMAKALKFDVSDVELVLGDGTPQKPGGIVVYGFSDGAKFMGAMPGDPKLGDLGQHNGQIKDHFDLVADWWLKFNLIKTKPDFDEGVSLVPFKVLVASGYKGE
jgi:NitT/TauT family transport system substrate-binding protein